MNFIAKIKKKFLQKLAKAVVNEIKLIDKKNKKNNFDLIKIKGKDSFFWGNEIAISKPENVEIGNNVHIGNNAFIKSDGGLKIGDNTHISRNVVIYTVNHNYKSNVLPYNHEMIKKEVVIGSNVWIGMNVCITPGTIIGDGCIVGMGTVVSGNVPPLTIIGSQKWTKIGERDKSKYYEILNKGRFGKENGLLYTDKNKILIDIGDTLLNERTHLELINFGEKKAIKKTFEHDEKSKLAFENEKIYLKKFKNYNWCPELYEIGDDYIIIEFIHNKYRLDVYEKNISSSGERNKIFGDILLCLIDIYGENTAHCDIHSRNTFVTPSGIKIIDFETSQEQKKEVDFFNSYDITGEGLLSPNNTNNRCFFSKGDLSLSHIFNVNDIEDLKILFNNYLVEELYRISGTFFTRKNQYTNRHKLRHRYIYSTFDLKYLKVNDEIGQRNIKKRISRFGVKNLKNKKVLDIGSNIGGILFEIMKMQPLSALGLEYDNDKVRIANTLKILNFKNHNISFEQEDVESSDFIDGFNEPFEIVFCLAIIEHIKDKDTFIKKLGNICTETMYFEGNSGTDVNLIKIKLAEVGFRKIEFIGYSDDEKNEINNNRPLIIARK